MTPHKSWTPETDGDVSYVPLTQGKYAIIDTADLDLVVGYKWHACRIGNTWYARNGGGYHPTKLMHRVIMGLSPGDPTVDHEDHNGLNNCRSNLREATHAQNMLNCASQGGTSRYKGVCWIKDKRRWRARVTLDGVHHYLGYYSDEVEAARAYDAGARELHGSFAWVNFP
jgi:hypothetical protein